VTATIAVCTTAGIALLGSALAKLVSGNRVWETYLVLVLGVVLAMTATGLLLAERSRRKFDRLYESRSLDDDGLTTRASTSRSVGGILDAFLDVTSSLPISVREELVYRLTRDGVGIPPDLAYRFSRELMIELRISSAESRGLLNWLDLLFSAPAKVREQVVQQLSRSVL
jgi:hypothetical protein